MRNPRIPTNFETLPQQRVVPVVSLPPRPAGFTVKIHHRTPLPARYRPKATPPSAIYLCLLEWATSYWECRQAGYYLSTNRSRRHWLLWVWDWDDNWGQWSKWLCAYGPRRGVPWRTAAMHLLRAALADDKRRCGQERFDWISEDFCLDVPDILAVAREVWS